MITVYATEKPGRLRGYRRYLRHAVAAVSVLALGVLAGVSPGGPAQATTAATTPGDHSSECAVDWRARTVLAVDLADTYNRISGVMTDLEGNPIDHYSNGGYLEEVAPALGGTGIFELNHWYSNDTTPSVEGTAQMWRLPIATDFTITNAQVELTLPAPITELSFDETSVNSTIARWGQPYKSYRWSALEDISGVSWHHNDDGSWSAIVPIGTLAGRTGTVFQFAGLIPAGTDLREPVEASARLTGTYPSGSYKCRDGSVDIPPRPVPPEVGQCEQLLMGRTLWSPFDPDITTRDKYFGAENGEVNADGWGMGADGWVSGATRTLRLYGATDHGLENVHYQARASQGLTFGGVGAIDTPGKGMLGPSGYDQAIVNPGDLLLSDDGLEISLAIEHMPPASSFSFNVPVAIAGAEEMMVIDSQLIGTYPGCEEREPEVIISEWIDGAGDCDTLSVSQSRTRSVTSFTWDPTAGHMVASEPEVTVEERTREMTEAEIAECTLVSPDPDPEPDPQPGPAPNPDPAPQPSPDPGHDSGLPSTGASLGLVAPGAGALIGIGLMLKRRRMTGA